MGFFDFDRFRLLRHVRANRGYRSLNDRPSSGDRGPLGGRLEDGAHAYITLAEALACGAATPGEAFNFSNEQEIGVLELTRRILTAMGSALEPDIKNEATSEIRRQYLSASRARARLGWTPLHNLQSGLEHTIAWYREFLAG